jgi:hypothetical protein
MKKIRRVHDSRAASALVLHPYHAVENLNSNL